jgi:hypothetical protein
MGGMLVTGCRGGHPREILRALAATAEQLSQNSSQGGPLLTRLPTKLLVVPDSGDTS